MIHLLLLECGLPFALIENIIKQYVQPLRVTEDDLRKIRVQRWLTNLSQHGEKKGKEEKGE